MAWIESHDRLARHPSMWRFAKKLGIGDAQAVGHLFLLWELFSSFEKKTLGTLTPLYVSKIARWDGDHEKFFNALRESGWITSDNSLNFQGCAHVVYGKVLRPGVHVWRVIRHRILSRDDFTCRYCGKKSPSMTVDHVVPVTRGGYHDESNLVAACRSCNSKNGNKLING